MSTSPSVPVGKRRPGQQEGHKLLCCGPAGAPAWCPRGAVSGRKGHFCAHAHLITGPIWSVPTVKQTPVLEEMDFRRQIHCSHRSPQQLSHANYFPFLVATAKSNCSPRGDSLCRLSVIWKCLTHSSARFQGRVFHWGVLDGSLFTTHWTSCSSPNGSSLFFRMACSYQTGKQPCEILIG